MKYYISFSFLLIGALVFRIAWYYQHLPVYKSGNKVVFEYVMLNEPNFVFGKQVFYVEKVKIVASGIPKYHYGDSMIIQGKIDKEEYSITRNNKLIEKRENLVIKNPKIELVKNSSSYFLASTSFIRQKVTETFNKRLNKDESGLLMGIVFGIRQGLSESYYEALKNTGVLHVVAASGMNVSMVGGFLQGLFLIFLPRFHVLFFTLFGIAFYAVLSGLDPSIVRASVMAGIAYSASIFGRQNYSYISLFMTGFIMIFLSPDLIQNIGFQLSFASTLGILSIKPIISNLSFLRSKSRIGFVDDFSTTFSAQTCSLPILLSSFGSYQILSLIANTFVLWTIPILMLLGGLAAIFSLFLPLIASVFLYLSYPFLLFFKFTIMTFSAMLEAQEMPQFPLFVWLGYYLILLAAVIYFGKKK